jgi:hypothetical protein
MHDDRELGGRHDDRLDPLRPRKLNDLKLEVMKQPNDLHLEVS